MVPSLVSEETLVRDVMTLLKGTARLPQTCGAFYRQQALVLPGMKCMCVAKEVMSATFWVELALSQFINHHSFPLLCHGGQKHSR